MYSYQIESREDLVRMYLKAAKTQTWNMRCGTYTQPRLSASGSMRRPERMSEMVRSQLPDKQRMRRDFSLSFAESIDACVQKKSRDRQMQLDRATNETFDCIRKLLNYDIP